MRDQDQTPVWYSSDEAVLNTELIFRDCATTLQLIYIYFLLARRSRHPEQRGELADDFPPLVFDEFEHCSAPDVRKVNVVQHAWRYTRKRYGGRGLI